MAYIKTSKCLGIIIFSIFLSVSCERTKDKMYKAVNGAFCYKRLNGTAEFGCTSSRSGDTGVVHIIRNESDINWLIDEASAGPYIVVITFKYFNRNSMLRFKNSGKVSGVVLTNVNETTIAKYSPDDSCPNRNSGLDGQCDSNNPWNPAGDSLLFENLGFPVIFVDSKETLEFIEKCFETHNSHDLDQQSTRSLCSIEIVSHNIAAVDTRTCMRRKMMASNLMQLRYCDPLGDRNIFLPLFPRTKPESNRSVILVTARLDGLSMFDGDVPGAKSPVTGIVSLITTAYYLHNMTKSNPEPSAPDGNIIFLLINGESFDYIGSSRIIYEMQNNMFPYKPVPDIPEEKQSPPLQMDSIGLIVELDEIVHPQLVLSYKC
ncbi:UNVERIFIED_CONTAM: hypothetical protein PYX00_001836 [Menopon gallinae]|uniref:Nicastrin n=1 Tax=Menopon gallinae TaxID=328185 RepID=A0AAW2IEA8_9NEOP